ncbi:hypothetical protein [Porphyromonas sp.]
MLMKTRLTLGGQRLLFSLLSAALFLGFSGLSVESFAQGTITLKTNKAKGDKVNLKVVALDEFTITGTEANPKPYGEGWATYTLTEPTITIKGKIEELCFIAIKATSITLEDCSDLVKLDCRQNDLTEIVLKNTNNIEELYCVENEIRALDLSNQTQLNSLDCSMNFIKTLSLKNCPLLTFLTCYENQLQTLDLTDSPNLQNIICSLNQISELKLGKVDQLTSLSATANHLRGEAMTHVVNALPDRTGLATPGTFGAYAGWDINEQNQCSTDDVAIARKKNWEVSQHDGEDWIPYPGVPSSLEAMGQPTPELYVTPSSKTLSINNATPHTSVRIYSTEGELMAHGKTDANGAARLHNTPLATGVYIVSIGGRTHKLLVP